ncbi:MAG: aspartyl-tRNA amidotransferase subunit B [Bacteroidia bacterium]|nr:MAG: aspartyl-tRNA amidotransferase subunit B [Bacteroidia bacterium]
MQLEEQIMAEIKKAMLNKDSKRLEALRAIKNVIIHVKTSPEGFTEENVIKTLQKEVKKRKDAAEIYTQQNRPDLAEVELYQAGVMEEFLPKQLSDDELKAVLQKIITEMGVTSAADMGKLMGRATKELAGKADNSRIAAIVKQLLV